MMPHVRPQTLLAWHYTTGKKFELIKNDRVLRPANIGFFPGELPMLWFSTNQVFELSALAVRVEDGLYRDLSLREMFDLEGGVVRLGYPLKWLKSGDELRIAARMRPEMWRALASAGKRMGANPSDWWGYVGALMLDEVAVEVMNADLTWSSV